MLGHILTASSAEPKEKMKVILFARNVWFGADSWKMYNVNVMRECNILVCINMEITVRFDRPDAEGTSTLLIMHAGSDYEK